jgi:hypothetical protein
MNFTLFFSLFPLPLSFQEAREMFNTFDKDRSGTLSFDEFLQALRVSLAIFMTSAPTIKIYLACVNIHCFLFSTHIYILSLYGTPNI